MVKRALLVGCNYPGSNAELNGCIGDVWGWKAILEEFYAFDPDNIKVYIDTDDAYPKPTGKNIKDALREVVGASEDGDILVFHFSGHGVQVPDDDEGEEADGMDEAICPCDFNMIIDDDMREILGPLDPGCKFTMISDCCHSGGMLDHEEVVIEGDADDDTEAYGDPQQAREINLADVGEYKEVNRAIDANMLTRLLSETVAKQGSGDGSGGLGGSLGSIAKQGIGMVQKEGLEALENKARFMLFSLFGDDSSNAASAHKSAPSSGYTRAGQKPADGKNDPNKGILITGCQATETSADVTGNEGHCFGALSHTFQKVVRRHHENHPGEPLTYRKATLKVRQLLNASGFSQNPCLECSEANADTNFIEF